MREGGREVRERGSKGVDGGVYEFAQIHAYFKVIDRKGGKSGHF